MSYILSFLLIACGGSGADTASAPIVEDGSCDRSGGERVQATILSKDPSYEMEPSPEWGTVIETEEAYQVLKGRFGQAMDPVDFSTHVVLGSWVYSDCTCGIELEGWQVDNVDGRPHLTAAFTDVSSGCETCCGDSGGALILVATARGNGPGSVCRMIQPGCTEE